ncbi:MAG: hypothetical protein ACLP1X_35300 [Polyangiaceae bacterium]
MHETNARRQGALHRTDTNVLAARAAINSDANIEESRKSGA